MPADPSRQTPPDEPSARADPLERLRDQIKATQEAAERLAEEAAEAARAAAQDAGAAGRERPRRRPPTRGYAVPGADAHDERYRSEVQALAAMIDLARDMMGGLVPHELRQQLLELVRELLLLLRSLLDWYIERVEQRRAAPVEIEEIPIT